MYNRFFNLHQAPFSIAPDPRIPEFHEELRRVKGSDFEVVTAPAP